MSSDGMNSAFDPTNPRVKLARRKRAYNRPVVITLNVILFLLFVVAGIAWLFFGFSIGWAFIGFSVVPLMFIYWIRNALAEVPVGPTNSFTDLLSEDLLVLLTKDTEPRDLAKIFPRTKSGMFLMARFGLPQIFFEDTAKYVGASVEPIYHTATVIRERTQSERITASVLITAFIEHIPHYDQVLNQLKLSVTDLDQGITWYNYLNGLVSTKKKSRAGGIGRDFAFGYTPTLQKYAVNLSERYSGTTTRIQQAENADIIKRMIDTLSRQGRENIALVGNLGSGRSTIVSYLAETLMNPPKDLPESLKYRQIYSLDAPSLISACRTQSDLEYLMIRILNEIYSAKNIILCLDNAHLFFENGPGCIDITNLLVPVLEAGTIRTIMIMDEQKFLELSQKTPALATALNKLVVHPTDRDETLRILMDQAPYIEFQKHVVYAYASLTEAYKLSEQYIHDIEMPGKARLLLENSAAYADEYHLVTAESVQTAVEKSYGVKVKVADSVEDREELLNLEALIHERMVDQMPAVSAVSNALRRAGAGVKSHSRPIGTFLFLGPTGVGKTELAKTLSEVYFDGEENIIRLDMNEFVSASDVSRLIRDGASDPMSLTAQVMKQPFSVILLDEIEKAHPSVLTTLLQVLDEGILRDEKNREVSFRDSIIICTSNAGANEIRERISAGEDLARVREDLVNKMIAAGEFKPEFLNRFDEICLFKPLSKEDLEQVLDLILAATNKTLSAQKISVTLTPEAKQILIERGYDPAMGARPMRRLVQKTVENIVAAAILSGAASAGSTLTITPSQINIS
ncbi:AAA family ATPase [Candidatus Saccharibacteria bacterium]|nr:AAA family ATPase [Candidatus Saccharibacteria bacterium]